MAPVLKDGKDPKVVALEWIKANPDSIKSWLDGVTTMDGGDAMAAVQKVIQ
jgi:glycine betaine/proline transport system substrate-binding protein